MIRFNKISDLTDPVSLSDVAGPVSDMKIEPFSTIGFSGSGLQRVKLFLQSGLPRNLVLKKTNLTDDWIASGSNDRVGREAALLNEAYLQKIWSVVQCPYIAFAHEGDSTALLMNDFSAFLFPDIRQPIEQPAEDIIIDTMAAMHALFWNSTEIKKIQWLTQPQDYLGLLAPGAEHLHTYPAPPAGLLRTIEEGWRIAFQLLSPRIKNYLTKPTGEIVADWKGIPVTLLHGDLKVANMAVVPGNKLVLFDWSLVACAPCAVELGWYLAVNSTRLHRTKEQFTDVYRSRLESHLHFPIDNKTWKSILRLTIISGALMLLWNKAFNYHAGAARSKEEWDWWVARLEDAV